MANAEVDSANETKFKESCESTWTFPPQEDGWYKAHGAIRYDMELLHSALGALQKRLDKGAAAFTPAEADLLRDFWQMFAKQVHDHHDHEEQFFFPWMKERIDLPARMTSDHTTLMDMMGETEQQFKALLATSAGTDQQTALQKLMPTYEKFVAEMDDHLAEEEKVCVPLMREAFTQNEANAVVSKMMKATMKPIDLAHFFHPQTPEGRKIFAKQEKMPWFLTALILPFALRSYEKQYIKPMQALIAAQ